MAEEMYDTSPEPTPEQIEMDDALHKLDKGYLIHKYGILAKKHILSPKTLNAICTIIDENNQNILKAIGFSRH